MANQSSSMFSKYTLKYSMDKKSGGAICVVSQIIGSSYFAGNFAGSYFAGNFAGKLL